MELTVTGYIAVGVLGLMMGSFAGATVWRIRARQLTGDKANGEPYERSELKRLAPLMKAKLSDDRSRCLHCGHQLAWYDLLPLISWLSTKGKCRYCHKTIGRFEPLIELGMATVFIVVYQWWVTMYGYDPFGLLWIPMLVMLVILFAYDAKWFLLPDVVMVPLAVLAIIYASYSVANTASVVPALFSSAGSVAILGGLYLLIWLASSGKWVGFGDVKLGVVLGLLLGDWKLAFLALFLANLIGTLVVLPGLLSKKLSRTSQVPFGPLLIIGFGIALVAGVQITDAYQQFSNWLLTSTLML